jgi:hypothetical protein
MWFSHTPEFQKMLTCLENVCRSLDCILCCFFMIEGSDSLIDFLNILCVCFELLVHYSKVDFFKFRNWKSWV